MSRLVPVAWRCSAPSASRQRRTRRCAWRRRSTSARSWTSAFFSAHRRRSSPTGAFSASASKSSSASGFTAVASVIALAWSGDNRPVVAAARVLSASRRRCPRVIISLAFGDVMPSFSTRSRWHRAHQPTEAARSLRIERRRDRWPLGPRANGRPQTHRGHRTVAVEALRVELRGHRADGIAQRTRRERWSKHRTFESPTGREGSFSSPTTPLHTRRWRTGATKRSRQPRAPRTR